MSSRSRRASLAVVPFAAALALAGCASGTTSARPKPSPPPAPAVYFLGDSYTVGVNGMPKSQTYASVLGRREGWRTSVVGYPYAGFVHRDKAGRDYADLFRQQLGNLPAPNTLVISGAHNDRTEPSRYIRTKAALLIAGVHHRWPATRIVVVGPMWGGTPTHAALRVRSAVRSAARSRHVPFIDPLGEKWITGDRGEGTGNAVKYVLPDETHPTRAGHLYLAERLREDLAKWRLLPR